MEYRVRSVMEWGTLIWMGVLCSRKGSGEMASVRTFYTREHPAWPTTVEEALDEISELNDLLDTGGWSKGQRDWIYQRRAKLVRYVNDPQYRIFTGGVNKAVETIERNKTEGENNE